MENPKSTFFSPQIGAAVLMGLIILFVACLPMLRQLLVQEETGQSEGTVVVEPSGTPLLSTSPLATSLLDEENHKVSDLIIIPTATIIATTTTTTITATPTTSAEPESSYPFLLEQLTTSEQVWSVAFSADGRSLAAGLGDGDIIVWEVEGLNASEPLIWSASQEAIYSVAFDPTDSTRLASGSVDQTINVWDVTTQQAEMMLTGHRDDVSSVAFAPDGAWLASASADREVKLWDLQTGTELHTFSGHEDWVLSVAFDPKQKLLASASADQTVKVWQLERREELYTLTGHTDWVVSALFYPTSTRLVSASYDEQVLVWDIERQRAEPPTSDALPPYSLSSLALTADGRWLAAGSHDYTILVWDLEEQRLLPPLRGHDGFVRSVAFSPDGRYLASGAEDGRVNVWQFQSNP